MALNIRLPGARIGRAKSSMFEVNILESDGANRALGFIGSGQLSRSGMCDIVVAIDSAPAYYKSRYLVQQVRKACIEHL